MILIRLVLIICKKYLKCLKMIKLMYKLEQNLENFNYYYNNVNKVKIKIIQTIKN